MAGGPIFIGGLSFSGKTPLRLMLSSHPNIAMISFTGSTAAGKRVGELASRHLKRVTLELGGKNSTIVLDDADLDVAASSAAWGAYLHQGQICMATGTVLAQRKIARDLTERLVGKAKGLPVGDHWEWDGARWREVLAAVRPGARSRAAAVYDSARGRTILFGGTNTGTVVGSLADHWEWDGAAWLPVNVATPSALVFFVAVPPSVPPPLEIDTATSIFAT